MRAVRKAFRLRELPRARFWAVKVLEAGDVEDQVSDVWVALAFSSIVAKGEKKEEEGEEEEEEEEEEKLAAGMAVSITGEVKASLVSPSMAAEEGASPGMV